MWNFLRLLTDFRQQYVVSNASINWYLYFSCSRVYFEITYRIAILINIFLKISESSIKISSIILWIGHIQANIGRWNKRDLYIWMILIKGIFYFTIKLYQKIGCKPLRFQKSIPLFFYVTFWEFFLERDDRNRVTISDKKSVEQFLNSQVGLLHSAIIPYILLNFLVKRHKRRQKIII